MKNDFTKGIFIKDENVRGNYTLSQPQHFYFSFLKVSPTKDEKIKKRGATFIIQSFKKLNITDKEKSKILHSGLLLVESINYEAYLGDNISRITNQKDFFIIKISPGILTMYYFNKTNPRNKQKFAREFLDSL